MKVLSVARSRRKEERWQGKERREGGQGMEPGSVEDGVCQQDGVEKEENKTKTRFRIAIQDTVSSSVCLG